MCLLFIFMSGQSWKYHYKNRLAKKCNFFFRTKARRIMEEKCKITTFPSKLFRQWLYALGIYLRVYVIYSALYQKNIQLGWSERRASSPQTIPLLYSIKLLIISAILVNSLKKSDKKNCCFTGLIYIAELFIGSIMTLLFFYKENVDSPTDIIHIRTIWFF